MTAVLLRLISVVSRSRSARILSQSNGSITWGEERGLLDRGLPDIPAVITCVDGKRQQHASVDED